MCLQPFKNKEGGKKKKRKDRVSVLSCPKQDKKGQSIGNIEINLLGMPCRKLPVVTDRCVVGWM